MIDALKALAADYREKSRRTGSVIALIYRRCAADLDKVIAQAEPATVTDAKCIGYSGFGQSPCGLPKSASIHDGTGRTMAAHKFRDKAEPAEGEQPKTALIRWRGHFDLKSPDPPFVVEMRSDELCKTRNNGQKCYFQMMEDGSAYCKYCGREVKY